MRAFVCRCRSVSAGQYFFAYLLVHVLQQMDVVLSGRTVVQVFHAEIYAVLFVEGDFRQQRLAFPVQCAVHPLCAAIRKLPTVVRADFSRYGIEIGFADFIVGVQYFFAAVVDDLENQRVSTVFQ